MRSELRTGLDCDHLFISAPSAFSGPEPALLLLHDSGADETQLLSVAEALAKDTGTNILSLRGWFPYREGYSFLFDGSAGVPDESLFIERANRVSAFLDWAVKDYSLNPERLLCFGIGDGATLAATLLFVHSELLGGAILVRPKDPFRPKPLPALPCYPILLLTGRKELCELEEQARALEETLFQCGCSVKNHRVHLDNRFDAQLVHASRDWFKKVSSTDISIACVL
jgi:phospholipase/carboxylesterase